MSKPREIYTFDEICDSREFNHEQEFIILTPEIQRKLELFDEAVEALKFYGDENNWSCSHSVVFTDINEDSEWLKRTDDYGSKNVDWEVGGKKARQFLKKLGEHNE